MDTLQELKSRIAEISDLHRTLAVLSWDQQTYMPAGGAESRAEQRSTLSRIVHELATSPRYGELLMELSGRFAGEDPFSDDAALVRQARRIYDRNAKLPSDLVAWLAKATSLGHGQWVQARAASDFAQFAPALERIVALKKEQAEAFGYEESPYDALIDYFEPQVRASELEGVFSKLREGLLSLIRSILERQAVIPRDFLFLEYDLEQQWQMSCELLRGIGYDFQRGRQDHSPHPFTTTFSKGDVRVTNRFAPRRMMAAMFAALHEGGHALYNQGLPERFDRTNLQSGASFGVHESQSRLWENLVGRSRGFWKQWLPRFREVFPQGFSGVEPEAFYRAINTVEETPIRVEADEVTYNLHVLLRFELEQDLFEGRLQVADLPEAWNCKTKQYLGFCPASDAQGVLQDMHWASGQFGYFPSYTLGNLLSVQFYEQALADTPGLAEALARGETAGLLAWTRERIHALGGKLLPLELVRHITGGSIDPAPFLAYLRRKYGEIYAL